MTNLSVNLNKIALLRNSRNIGFPSVIEATRTCVAAGAQGITVHPRPDQRHTRPADVFELADWLPVEFNVEGNPFPEFIEIVKKIQPTQVTLVPDSPDAFTSDHGWILVEEGATTPEAAFLQPIVRSLQQLDIRVSLFMETDLEQIEAAKVLGIDRIELYTEPYARAFGLAEEEQVLETFRVAVLRAQELGLGVNAGHDLNLNNLPRFVTIPGILEVSIGHALIADALDVGLARAVESYLRVLVGQ